MASEIEALREQLDHMTLKARNAEVENKQLIDRWMLEKMNDAERLNEVSEFFIQSSIFIRYYSISNPF